MAYAIPVPEHKLEAPKVTVFDSLAAPIRSARLKVPEAWALGKTPRTIYCQFSDSLKSQLTASEKDPPIPDSKLKMESHDKVTAEILSTLKAPILPPTASFLKGPLEGKTAGIRKEDAGADLENRSLLLQHSQAVAALEMSLSLTSPESILDL